MTNEIEAVVRSLISNKDVEKKPNGKLFLSHSASLRVASHCGIILPGDEPYELDAAVRLLNSFEIGVRAKLSKITEWKDCSPRLLAHYLMNEFTFKDIKHIYAALNRAEQSGIIPHANRVINSILEIQTSMHITLQLKSIQLKHSKDQQKNLPDTKKYFESLFRDFIETAYFDSMDAHRSLYDGILNAKIDKFQLFDIFYDCVEQDLGIKYSGVKNNPEEIADALLNKYIYFDIAKVLQRFSRLQNTGVSTADIAYRLYQKDEEQDVVDAIMAHSGPDVHPFAILGIIHNLSLSYPDFCIVNTLKKLQAKGLVLPYNELYEIFTRDENNINAILIDASKSCSSASEITKKIYDLYASYPAYLLVDKLKILQAHGLVLPYNELYETFTRHKNPCLRPHFGGKTKTDIPAGDILKNLLLQMSNNGMDPESMASDINEFSLEYPDVDINVTIDQMESSGLVLPYDEIRKMTHQGKLK